MTNVWSGNAKQPQFEKWNTAALHDTKLKSAATAIQKKNTDAQAKDKTAMDTANALVTSTLQTYNDDKKATATAVAVTPETVATKEAVTKANAKEAKSKTAWDSAVTAAVAPTTKYDQITAWVVSGVKYIHNDWNGSQAW